MFFFLTVVILVVLYVLYENRAKNAVPSLPTIPGVPYFGNLFSMLAQVKSGTWAEWCDIYYVKFGIGLGKSFTYCTPDLGFSKSWIVVCDPKLVEYVLNDNFDNFMKGPAFHEVFEELLADGIFNIDGPEWKKQRKISSHMFSQNKLRQKMMSSFIRHSSTVLNILDKSAESETVLDMQKLYFDYTLDSITDIAFGYDSKCLEDAAGVFGVAWDNASQVTAKRFLVPAWWFKLMRVFNLGEEKQLKKYMTVINTVVADVIRERRRDDHLEEKNDLLSLFIEDAKRKGEGELSDGYLRDIILSFIVAGRDTTGWLLTITTQYIFENPDVHAKMLDEIKRVCGNAKQPTFDMIGQMEYVKAVAYEALRLHPSVPLDGKYVVNDDELPDGTKIPAGAIVQYPIFSLCRDTRLWGPDAREFKPDRWFDKEKNSYNFAVPESKFPAFNVGRRLCLGKPMAALEVVFVLAMILPKFDIKLVPETKRPNVFGITLRYANGLLGQVIRR